MIDYKKIIEKITGKSISDSLLIPLAVLCFFILVFAYIIVLDQMKSKNKSVHEETTSTLSIGKTMVNDLEVLIDDNQTGITTSTKNNIEEHASESFSFPFIKTEDEALSDLLSLIKNIRVIDQKTTSTYKDDIIIVPVRKKKTIKPTPKPKSAVSQKSIKPAMKDYGIYLYGASWCGPCKEIKDGLEKRGIVVHYTDVEKKKVPQEIINFMNRSGLIPVVNYGGVIDNGQKVRKDFGL